MAHLGCQEMKKHNVRHLVRVCEPAYPAERVTQAGIEVHVRYSEPTLRFPSIFMANVLFFLIDAFTKEWNFPDGEEPPTSVIDNWLNLVEACKQKEKEEGRPITIAVHCVAGLGRSVSGDLAFFTVSTIFAVPRCWLPLP